MTIVIIQSVNIYPTDSHTKKCDQKQAFSLVCLLTAYPAVPLLFYLFRSHPLMLQPYMLYINIKLGGNKKPKRDSQGNLEDNTAVTSGQIAQFTLHDLGVYQCVTFLSSHDCRFGKAKSASQHCQHLAMLPYVCSPCPFLPSAPKPIHEYLSFACEL